MKFTYDWLKDYLDTDATAEQIAESLTTIGLEVDDVETAVVPVAAKIVECGPVAGSDHLHALQVDDGTGTLRQVVCGAPNARVGLVSALALPGCKIGGMEIKSGKIRGVLSDGMMCSEKELGLGGDHGGIIELNESAEPGTPISQILTINFQLSVKTADAVFTAGITPNRPDYLAVRGIARDLAAAGLGKFNNSATNRSPLATHHSRKAVIKSPAACPVYRLCEIRGIKLAPSNPTVSARLAAIGINPKNAPVDATNYVCFDIGQPMHCFDADEIEGDIIIRNASAGEKFTDLFGAEHTLTDADLVIADEAGILALAGIVGGARGMTTDKTENIILESAYFSPVGIRKTGRRLGLSTDASYRYERGIDPTITGDALDAAVKIITDACGGEIAGYFTAGRVESLELRVEIEYSPDLFKKMTGMDLEPKKQKEILEKLGFKVETSQLSTLNSQLWRIVPTPARVDVVIPENIVSELIRICGYDKIESKAHDAAGKDENNSPLAARHSIKVKLASLGLMESITYGFGDSSKEAALSDKQSIKIDNPIVANFDTARNNLVQSMLDVVAANDRFRRSNLNMFELGAVFDGDRPGQQHDQLIIARTGIAGDKIGVKHGRPVEIYDVRADLLDLFPGAAIENDPAPPKYAHPYRAGRVIKDGIVVAQFAELHPTVAKKFGIKTKVVLGVVDNADAIPQVCRGGTTSDNPSRSSENDFPDFPLITRDFAFVVDGGVSPDALAGAVAAGNPIIVEANVFDVFDMGGGKKSIALEIVIQPASNMSDTDLLDLQNKIIAEAKTKFDADIRDK